MLRIPEKGGKAPPARQMIYFRNVLGPIFVLWPRPGEFLRRLIHFENVQRATFSPPDAPEWTLPSKIHELSNSLLDLAAGASKRKKKIRPAADFSVDGIYKKALSCRQLSVKKVSSP